MQNLSSLQMRRLRAFLLLSLRDVEGATGVSAERLSKAERGLIVLNATETRCVQHFYEARYQMAQEEAGEETANPVLGV